MSRYDERKKTCVNTCAVCKHCHPFMVYYNFCEERVEELFCMLDVSEEDIYYVVDQQPLDDEGHDYSPRLLEIMKMKEGDELWKGRQTSCSHCCQFYEGMNKKEESKDA